MPHALSRTHDPSQPAPAPIPARAHALQLPAGFAVAVGWIVGVMAFCAVIFATFWLVGRGRVGGEPVWTVPDTGWRPWAVVGLASVLPLLVTASITTWLAQGTSLRRLRLCAVALLALGGAQALSAISGEPRRFMTITGWLSATPERLVITSLAVTLAAAAIAWMSAWLTLAVAAWQPPAHLVRRPLPPR